MAEFKIKITGDKEVARMFGKMESTMPDVMEKASKAAVLYAQSKLPGYPPAPPTSTYRRTLTLGRTITTLKGIVPDALSRVERLGKAVRGIIGTALEYAEYVIQKSTQASVHVGRWWTLEEEVIKNEPGIIAIYKKEFDAWITKHGR